MRCISSVERANSLAMMAPSTIAAHSVVSYDIVPQTSPMSNTAATENEMTAKALLTNFVPRNRFDA